tara:strand:+ start:78 stop:791 length:714 start_codon:yes stop_codon:yes gene_type:complete
MIKAYLLMDYSLIDKALEAIFLLPSEIVPTHYGESDNKKASKKLETSEFIKFKKKHTLGYILFGANVSYAISISPNDTVEITLFTETIIESSIIYEYVMSLATLGAFFGYACEDSEYKHRNQVLATIKGNHIEAWVGRNIDQYVSGLYWVTFISYELKKKFNLNIDEFLANAYKSQETEYGHILQFYDSPQSWESHQNEIDGLCQNSSGVFSKKEASSELEPIDDVIKFFDVMHKHR